MGGNVWTRLSAWAVGSVSSLFASSRSLRSQDSGGASPSAPARDASSTSISTSATSRLLRIQRNPSLQTTDALFGAMDFNGVAIGVTMERTAVAIPEGTYRGYKRDSARFGMRVVGIDVPNRTDIECHPANFPRQLDGCIAIGETKDGDAIDNSRSAFDRMMAVVPEEFTVEVSSLPS
jgi:Family of unknown function (DUF5675)